ncbi:hypothetical protein DV736_g2392, partial [Chaetothyriales sp. CBS 134916]
MPSVSFVARVTIPGASSTASEAGIRLDNEHVKLQAVMNGFAQVEIREEIGLLWDELNDHRRCTKPVTDTYQRQQHEQLMRRAEVSFDRYVASRHVDGPAAVAAEQPLSSAIRAAELRSFIIQIILPQPSRSGQQWADTQPRSETPQSEMAAGSAASEAETLGVNWVEELELFVRVRQTLVPVFYRTLSEEIDEMVGGEVPGRAHGPREGGGEGGERTGARTSRGRARGWSREFVEECKEYKARYAMHGQHDPSGEFIVER